MGIWARGDDPRELFEAIGLALYARIADPMGIRTTASRAVSATGADPGALVVAYLGELLRLQQEEGFIGRRIVARPIGTPPTSVLAQVEGEVFDPTRHRARTEVKAVTFHRLEVDLAAGRARVILDI